MDYKLQYTLFGLSFREYCFHNIRIDFFCNCLYTLKSIILLWLALTFIISERICFLLRCTLTCAIEQNSKKLLLSTLESKKSHYHFAFLLHLSAHLFTAAGRRINTMTNGQSLLFDKQQCFWEGRREWLQESVFYGFFRCLSIKPF